MRLRPYLLLLLLSLLVYLPVMKSASRTLVDFDSHIEFALALPNSTQVNHVLFHAIFLSIHQMAPSVPHTDAALAAILLVMLPVPLIVFAWLRKAADDSLSIIVLIALSLALTIVASITIWSNRYMIGYINPIVYHNPTSIAARLFVIPLSLLAFRIFLAQPYRNLNHRVYVMLLSAPLVLLSILAKPSYAFALLPACGLFALWRVYRRQRVDWLLLLGGFCIPGGLLSGLLYLLAYASAESESAIRIGVFTFIHSWIPTWRIPIQFLLSLVFPLAVFALYFARARRNLYLIMCWVIFAVSVLPVYFLYEDGTRAGHGNLIWGSYNAIFLLMFASLLFLVKQHAREAQSGSSDFSLFGSNISGRLAIAMLAFGLHLLSGIAYYYRFIAEW